LSGKNVQIQVFYWYICNFANGLLGGKMVTPLLIAIGIYASYAMQY